MKDTYHVVPYQGKWAVRRAGSRRVSSVHATKREAEAVAKQTAERQAAEYKVYRSHRTMGDVDSYGPDPLPPKPNETRSRTVVRVTVSPTDGIVISNKVLESMGVAPGAEFQIIKYENRIELMPVREIAQIRGAFKGIDTTVVREGDRV